MVVVAPTQSQPVLPAPLNLGRSVASLPKPSLLREEKLAGRITIHHREHLFESRERVFHAIGIVRKIALARAPEFARLEHATYKLRRRFADQISAVAQALERFEARAISLNDR